MWNSLAEVERGSPIRAYVKVGPLVTHPARVADVDDSNFRPIFAVDGSGKDLFLKKLPALVISGFLFIGNYQGWNEKRF
ncbi:hypothetical protein OUZ56_021781 [Daphnia magna]|uniref:Uncharacterized protein n=1 Tax=Daphnia magna TaxID=35525 RepID=A0ABR0AUF4_9CRUS|nr:hypothetical protein OUZ56_021781 [Daphnia magna]